MRDLVLRLMVIQRLHTTDNFQGDNRVTFSWPKMHSIVHLIESIRGVRATPPLYS